MVKKSESLGLEQGIIFQKTNQLVKHFSLDYRNRELPIKNIKKNQMVLFWLACASDLSRFLEKKKTATVG